MLSQGNVSAPLYHYTGQVGPRFWDSGSLVEWKWCHNVMFEANIHLRPLHTSTLGIFKVFEPLVCCLKGIRVHPYYTSQADPRFGDSWSLVEWKWCHHVMVEADVHLRPFHTFLLCIYKVFEQLLCCLKSMLVLSYTLTPAKLAPDLGIQVHLRSENDAITSCFGLISTSDPFIHKH